MRDRYLKSLGGVDADLGEWREALRADEGVRLVLGPEVGGQDGRAELVAGVDLVPGGRPGDSWRYLEEGRRPRGATAATHT